MQDLSQIKTVLDSSAGKQMKDYLLAKLLELRDISNLREFETTAATSLELKAQLRAYKKLREILEAIMTFESDPKEKDPRDSYDVL